MRAARLCVLLALQSVQSRSFLEDLFSTTDWQWTDRLGLSFTDDCQESRGLFAIFAWAESWISGRGGRQRSGNCETKEASCPPGVAVTGLRVRSMHARRGGNREWYDFSLRCGAKWTGAWLGLAFDARPQDATLASGACPDGVQLTGVQVMRGRSDGPNARDYYTFKLRCQRDWMSIVGLPFDTLRETRSATCPSKRSVGGIRVHRGFQDWGSVDTYEFQVRRVVCITRARILSEHSSFFVHMCPFAAPVHRRGGRRCSCGHCWNGQATQARCRPRLCDLGIAVSGRRR